MSGVLVDSDILIEVLRGRRAEAVRKWKDLVDQAEPIFCSPVSIAEIHHGWTTFGSGRASDNERTRLNKTEEELPKMQADLDQGRWDDNILNDVIDSIRKSSNDDRLPPRDRDLLADDLNQLKELQDQHNHGH
jgi:hypothetical protein